MRPTRLAAVLIAAIALAMSASGCSDLVHSLLRNRGEMPITEAPIPGVDAPDPALATNPVVATSAHSVVKVRSTAHSCQKILEGSGVVITPSRVMSGAHVVAGADEFTVSVDGQDHPATVVSFDPDMDIAILDVPDLPAPPLDFAHDIAASNSDAVVLGYPGGGPFVANPARIREVIELKGPDIYRTKTVTREVYTIRGKVGQGDSGGPLIDLDGRVLGINFGAAADDPETGFALTARQVYAEVIAATDAPVATGACVS